MVVVDSIVYHAIMIAEILEVIPCRDVTVFVAFLSCAWTSHPVVALRRLFCGILSNAVLQCPLAFLLSELTPCHGYLVRGLIRRKAIKAF